MYCGSLYRRQSALSAWRVQYLGPRYGAGERQTSGNRILRKLGEDSFIGRLRSTFTASPSPAWRSLVECTDLDCVPVFRSRYLRVDFRFNVTVSGAGDAHAYRADAP